MPTQKNPCAGSLILSMKNILQDFLHKISRHIKGNFHALVVNHKNMGITHGFYRQLGLPLWCQLVCVCQFSNKSLTQIYSHRPIKIFTWGSVQWIWFKIDWRVERTAFTIAVDVHKLYVELSFSNHSFNCNEIHDYSNAINLLMDTSTTSV